MLIQHKGGITVARIRKHSKKDKSNHALAKSNLIQSPTTSNNSYKPNELVFYVVTDEDVDSHYGKREGYGEVMITPLEDYIVGGMSDSFHGEPFLEESGFYCLAESWFEYDGMTRDEAINKLKNLGLREGQRPLDMD